MASIEQVYYGPSVASAGLPDLTDPNSEYIVVKAEGLPVAEAQALLKLESDVAAIINGGKVSPAVALTIIGDLSPVFTGTSAQAVLAAFTSIYPILSGPGPSWLKYVQLLPILASVFVH